MTRRFFAPLGWAALIFASSSLPGPSLPSPAVPHLDKLAHAGAYAVLGWLVARAMGARSVKAVAAATAIAALYGASDELHQAFVPGRDPSVADALADLGGALCGALLWRGLILRRSGRS